jgi:hypothetical protein
VWSAQSSRPVRGDGNQRQDDDGPASFASFSRRASAAARADATERRRQEQLAHDAAAKAVKAQLDSRMAELRTILASALLAPPQLPSAISPR